MTGPPDQKEKERKDSTADFFRKVDVVEIDFVFPFGTEGFVVLKLHMRPTLPMVFGGSPRIRHVISSMSENLAFGFVDTIRILSLPS